MSNQLKMLSFEPFKKLFDTYRIQVCHKINLVNFLCFLLKFSELKMCFIWVIPRLLDSNIWPVGKFIVRL